MHSAISCSAYSLSHEQEIEVMEKSLSEVANSPCLQLPGVLYSYPCSHLIFTIPLKIVAECFLPTYMAPRISSFCSLSLWADVYVSPWIGLRFSGFDTTWLTGDFSSWVCSTKLWFFLVYIVFSIRVNAVISSFLDSWGKRIPDVPQFGNTLFILKCMLSSLLNISFNSKSILSYLTGFSFHANIFLRIRM